MTKSNASKAVGVSRSEISRVAVIGAGTMGGGIAAQFANAGLEVDLLDLARGDGGMPDAVARSGIARQLKIGGFMHPERAALVRPGSIDQDLACVADADWIVEAITENLQAKQDLYRQVEAVRRPGSIVSSNTSTIPRGTLLEGMPERFAADFLITHFFNPPRAMRLVELVPGKENGSALIGRVRGACETLLGKTVIDCRDTPGFIANRIGCFWMAAGIIEAIRAGIDIEQADAAMTVFGTPKTGVFGLLDLIGIDLVDTVWVSLTDALPADDLFQQFNLAREPRVRDLIATGRIGRKAKAGFYRVAGDGSREAVDLVNGEYRAEARVDAKSLPGGGRDAKALIESDTAIGKYAARVLELVVRYAAEVGPSIASDVGAVDQAMVFGYAWKEGPFALAERLGLRHAPRLQQVPLIASAAGRSFFTRTGAPLATDSSGYADAPAPSVLAAAKAAGPRIAGNAVASLWDLGDGVACFEMHTKMNSFAPDVFDVLGETLKRGGHDFSALVLGNDDARAFSAGADLAYFVGLVRQDDWQGLDDYLANGQRFFLGMKYAPFPIVAAAHGFALGGGCELMLHAGAIVAHAELTAGLPETKVGIIPGWGGCTQLLIRAGEGNDAESAAAIAFKTIFEGQPSTSALDAQAKRLLRPTDGYVMSRHQLITAAKQRAMAMAKDYTAPARARIALASEAGKRSIMADVEARRAAGQLTDADLVIADALSTVLTGGAGASAEAGEEDIMAQERQAVLHLARQKATRERIDHMLKTGKPLRN